MFPNPRLNRLFAADGKCFDLAIDHGVFGNPAFLAGIEDLPAAVATAVDDPGIDGHRAPGRRRGRSHGHPELRRASADSVAGTL